MFSKSLIITGVLLVLPLAHGAEPAACLTTMDVVAGNSASSLLSTDDPDAIVFEVGEIEAQLSDRQDASMTGGVVLRQGNKVAGADSARYDGEQRTLHLEGGVRYDDPETQIASDSAEFSYDSGRIRFEGAEFSLGNSNGRGSASAIEVNQQGRLELDDVSYTTCPPESNDWVLEANDIDLDTREGIGTAKGIKLRFQGVPILYAPYLSFPIGDARKSGVLTPEIGSTSRSGNEIRAPFYWNIAPNYDATITPRLLTDRGLQLQTQFRYLTRTMRGRINADYLDSDDITNNSRSLLSLRHRSLFANGWRNLINFRQVSDDEYFEDLGNSLSVSSITHLNRSISLDYYTDNWSFYAQVQDYQQIIDETLVGDVIVPLGEPYQRVPQMLVSGGLPYRWLGTRLKFDGEIVYFDRDSGVTGWRLNAAPEVSLPIARPGWFVTPAISLDYTRYDLNDTLPGQDDKPSRTLPIGSLDMGMIFERAMKNSSRLQTIEPRFLYVHVPFRKQSQLPVFDTITPDLNIVQLYRKNRFLGIDRIADTDQLSVGVTSRIIDVSTGRELVTATIGQTRYLSESGVLLPNESFNGQESSDYVAEIRFLLANKLNFDIGHQWGTSSNGTTRSEARLQYHPAAGKVLNLEYRFRRDSFEQGDISWSWPLSSKWNIVGRYNYSFRDDEALEQFFGLEYESCCWGLRLVTRRHISTRDGTRDSSFGLQLILKGMTSVGTAADKMLERGILGYSADLR